jgi:hypothetical protein
MSMARRTPAQHDDLPPTGIVTQQQQSPTSFYFAPLFEKEKATMRCRSPVTSILALAAAMILSIGNQCVYCDGAVNNPCTLCVGGGDFNPDMRIGTVPCQQVQDLLQATPADTPVCYDAQLQGYLYCSCASYPSNAFCSMCEGGGTELTAPMFVPDSLAPKTCQESLFSTISNNEECRLIAEAADVCGCVGATAPNCTFCGIGNVQYEDRTLPPDFTTTCQEFSDTAPTITNATECDGLASGSPIDARAYCGCSDKSTATCRGMCEQGTFLTKPDAAVTLGDGQQSLTCRQAFDLALATVDESYCEQLQQLSPDCCGEAPAPTTSSSTPSPASSPEPASSNSTPTSAATALRGGRLAHAIAAVALAVLLLWDAPLS